jgi:sec-independent protein translocase protein TatA
MGIDMGFDALQPWHIIVLVVVLVLLFGSRRLPGAAKSLGESMHIFKRSVQGMHDEGDNAANPPYSSASGVPPSATSPAVTSPAVTAPTAGPTQQQLADLQRQVDELQRQATAANGQRSESQTTQPF